MIALLIAFAFASPEAADPHAFVRVDARGAMQSIDAVAATLDALPDARRAQVAVALRDLSASDPYTRAALELPFVLDRIVASISEDQLDPLVRADWRFLQAGLATHVDLLRSMGVEAPLPDDRALGSRIAGIVPDASRLDAPTRARIEALSDEVERLTGVVRPCPRGPHAVFPGQPWTLGMQLGGWHDVLRRVEPFVGDPATQDQVAEGIALLDAYGEAATASIYGLRLPR